MRQVIIYPGEDGYWVVECPSLPGCISQGKTREEAIQNIKEAIQGYVAALEEGGVKASASATELEPAVSVLPVAYELNHDQAFNLEDLIDNPIGPRDPETKTAL